MPIEIMVFVALLGFAGGLVQGTVGFGFAVVASPIIALVKPELVPVAILIAVLPVPFANVLTEWRHLDWPAVGWVVLGRIPAIAAGVMILKVVSPKALETLIGAIVLAMVVLTVVKITIPRNPFTLFLGGAVGGITGTASGIGGPPVAIVFANDEPPVARASLGAVFIAGTFLSLTGLAIGGLITPDRVVAGLLMIPTTMLGFAASLPLRKRVTPEKFRTAVIILAGLAATTLLVRSFLGS